MDFFGLAIGLLALVLSALSLWQGQRSDNTTRKLIDDLTKQRDRESEKRDRESDRVDKLITSLIETLKNLSVGST